MITARHRLHFANGKDSIKEERLRPYDKAKHDIYKALNEELPKATDWNELKESLSNRGIDMTFKVSRTTQEIQGLKSGNGKYTFSGSKVGREFSYMNIDYQLRQNAFDESFKNRQTISQVPKEDQ